MPESNNFVDDTLPKKFKDLNERLDKFSSILEKFGLDIITKMGQTNLKITQLTDKVNDLHKATIDIKSLSPQLSNVIESQKDLEKEVDLLKSLITNLKFAMPKTEPTKESIERDETATDKKELIISQLNKLKSTLGTNENSSELVSALEKIKEEIFEFTGGHRILYEISQTINRLNTIGTLKDLYDKNNPNNGTMEEYLIEKLTFWINKLMVKD
ncbi:MAG: DUF244 domain-containing protein [Candidatus Hermodarchaeota archaeon]